MAVTPRRLDWTDGDPSWDIKTSGKMNHIVRVTAEIDDIDNYTWIGAAPGDSGPQVGARLKPDELDELITVLSYIKTLIPEQKPAF